MSLWIEKEDALFILMRFKEICKSEDEAYIRAADAFGISVDRFIEIVGEEE